MNALETALPWFDEPLYVVLRLGELSLWESRTDGRRCHPDIFLTPPLESLQPVLDELAGTTKSLAFVYSIPVSPSCPTLAFARGRVAFVDKRFQHYYVDTRGSFEAYLEPRNKKTMSTLRRKVRKVEAMSPEGLAFRVYSRPEQIDAFFDAALPVSVRSYQSRLLGQGLPSDPQFRAELRSKIGSKEIFAYTLHLGERAIAYTVCPIYGQTRALYDHTGFDPEYAEYSPGAVLQFKIVEDLCRRDGIDYYDLCTGEGQHKATFATGSIECANIFVFNLLSIHGPLFVLRWLLDNITALAARILTRMGVKDRIKRLIRRAA